MSLEDIITDQILSEPEFIQAQILQGLPLSIRENIWREKSIRRETKAAATIVAAMRRVLKKPEIGLLRWALHKYPVTVGQMTEIRTVRTCLAREISAYYCDGDDEIDLITFLRWLDWNKMIGTGSKLVDIIYQILFYSRRKRELFCTRVLQNYYDTFIDDREISSEVREGYYDLSKVGEYIERSEESFENLLPFIGDIEMDDFFDMLPRNTSLDVRGIELLLSLLDDKRDLLQLYATIPSFEEVNKHSQYFNRRTRPFV
jgi:hypothetical protein